jgi:hypothetical protein
MQMIEKNIFRYFTEHLDIQKKTWLILGKGPSFSLRRNYDLSQYKIISLNDSVRELERVDIAHFIDFDAYERSAQILSQNPSILVVLPWFPHFKNKAGTENLAKLSTQHVLLSKLTSEGRLYWYDLITSPIRHGDYPVVLVKYFSAEAAFDLLATAGVKHVKSLGIDGGKAYSEEFSNLKSISLLANGHKNFDNQFESFAKTIAKTGVDYAPLNMETPIRIFIGSSASEALPFKVLEYSIRQHASTTVKITPLCDVGIRIPQPLASENRPRTPFSFQRFLIPQACGYAGHAIYIDSDMLVFKDITDLWRRPLGEANVLAAYSTSASGRIPQFSVMLIDCGRLTWNISDIVDQLNLGILTYEQLMYEFSLAKISATIEPEWNSLEAFKEGRTALLHFTDMSTQPWISHLNPLGFLWVSTLRQALEDGFISREFVEDEVRKGHVRPSLLYQIDHNIDDAFLLEKSVIAVDAQFTPHKKLSLHQASPWKNRLKWLKAILRAEHQRTALYKLERKILRWLK